MEDPPGPHTNQDYFILNPPDSSCSDFSSTQQSNVNQGQCLINDQATNTEQIQPFQNHKALSLLTKQYDEVRSQNILTRLQTNVNHNLTPSCSLDSFSTLQSNGNYSAGLNYQTAEGWNSEYNISSIQNRQLNEFSQSILGVNSTPQPNGNYGQELTSNQVLTILLQLIQQLQQNNVAYDENQSHNSVIHQLTQHSDNITQQPTHIKNDDDTYQRARINNTNNSTPIFNNGQYLGNNSTGNQNNFNQPGIGHLVQKGMRFSFQCFLL